MRRFLFLSAIILFFLSINIQPASAVTCCTNPLDQSTCFQVQRTCFSDSGCAVNEKCDYGGAWCGWPFTSWPPAFGGPCKPLDCKDCKEPINHQCLVAEASSDKCCISSCTEGGSGYSASLFDQKCYDYKDVTNDVNNCGACGNKCTGGKVCKDGKCEPLFTPPTCTNPTSYSNSNNCQSAGCTWCAPPAYSGYCAASSGDCKAPCTKNTDCKNVCDPSGCNLEYMVCGLGGVCEPLGKSKFCGMGSSCDKAVECYTSTGACGSR